MCVFKINKTADGSCFQESGLLPIFFALFIFELFSWINVLRVEQIVESVVSTLGYEVVKVEFVPQHKNSILRVYIDSENGIKVEDCEKVSRQISAVMDVEDPIAGHYTLEVSSPGIDRPLVKPEHFKKFCGRRVKVLTHNLNLGRKRFTGQLTQVNDAGIVVEVDGEAYDLSFDDINNAKLCPEWT